MRGWPTPRAAQRGRLADRHQRHAGDDGLQLRATRLLSDHRRGVQTPTLSIVVEREEKIARHRAAVREVRRPSTPPPAATRSGSTRPSNATSTTPRRAPTGCGTRDAQGHAPGPRYAAGRTSSSTKPSRARRPSPLLYDLTTCNAKQLALRFSARTSCRCAQTCTQAQVLTYPRTDRGRCPRTIWTASRRRSHGCPASAGRDRCARSRARPQSARRRLRQTDKRVSTTAKVSDTCGSFPHCSRRVADRDRAQPTTCVWAAPLLGVSIRVPSSWSRRAPRRSGGRPALSVPDQRQGGAPWLAGGVRQRRAGTTSHLVAVAPASRCATKRRRRRAEGQAPARYTEATLLSAMKAPELVDDEELRRAMRDKVWARGHAGADDRDGLIAEKYMLRDGREMGRRPRPFG